MSEKKTFNKPPLSINDQITLLQRRGLTIDSPEEAEHYLSTISYYRLTSYSRPFLVNPKNSETGFKQGTLFSTLLALYVFDRELRILVTDALERIEVALRTAISNTMSVKYGAHWYLDQRLFANFPFYSFFTAEISTELKRSKEVFIQHYYNTYSQPEHPPSWMVMECLSFGTTSKLYSNLNDRAARKQIGDVFGQFNEVLISWMRSLTFTRNCCAHHSRLWNRFFINKPKQIYREIFSENTSPFSFQAYIIIKLLNKIAPNHHFTKKLFSLFEKNAFVPFHEMGFLENWKEDPIWKE